MVTPTAQLTADDLRQARDLMDAAFDDFTDDDWSHALGGLHALRRGQEGQVVAHAALVQRRLLVRGRSLRCGYVEAVAVDPRLQRHGLGSEVMAEIEAHGPAHDVLALSASEAATAFYEARGWEKWRGPSSVVTPDGLLATPEEDGSIYVLGGTGLDLDAPIACDWRDGDVW